MPDFFNREASRAYDDKNSKLAPISENMHFLIRLVLKGLPPRSRVLCVGVGTGAEILSLFRAFPDWTFLGVDPSAEMLKVCIFTNSPDEHFIIDRLPDAPQVSLFAGESGHGYKFASVIGEILADLAIDGETRHDIGFLRLDRFG
jgi:SAM-dependent methyltransferase